MIGRRYNGFNRLTDEIMLATIAGVYIDQISPVACKIEFYFEALTIFEFKFWSIDYVTASSTVCSSEFCDRCAFAPVRFRIWGCLLPDF